MPINGHREGVMRKLTALEEKSIRETFGYLVKDKPINLLTTFVVKEHRYYLLSMTNRYIKKTYIMACPDLERAVFSQNLDLRIGKVVVVSIV